MVRVPSFPGFAKKNLPARLLESFLYTLLMLLILVINSQLASAITTKDLRSLHVPFWDPSACTPGGASLQGLEALRSQEGLDPQWVEVIGTAAQEKGVDPIFMAGLLWVENRGYPEYKSSGWHVSANSGTGPWAIIQSVWPPAAGDYVTGAQDPLVATPVAAELIKNMGGDNPNLPMGSIRDDFSRGNNLQTVAALGKNYNAGGATWREPGVAGHKEPGRVWMKPSGAWGATKNTIIDNYIVIFQHIYYHIATGKQIPSLADNNVHAEAALAMIDEIESYVPSGGDGSSPGGNSSGGCPGSSAGGGDVVATALEYAWPEYKGRGFTEKKTEYDNAIAAAIAQGMYVGGCKGVDCGAFVTRVMIDSGYEPEYNYGGKGGATPVQKKWLDENWESLGEVSSTSELEPGDVAWQPGHTFMFVGDQPGFETPIASSSLCQRAPMAGKESISGSGIVWYRRSSQ